MTINKQLLMTIHTLLAVFLLPIAIMFFVTGALYIWDVKGEREKSHYEITLPATFTGDIDEFVKITKNKLTTLNLAVPTGTPKIKNRGGNDVFEWQGTAIAVSVGIDSKLLLAKMEVNESSWYRYLVQLHKAKGGVLFKVYATVLSIAMLILLATGFVMAWQVPKLRKLTVLSTIFGFATFFMLAANS